MSVLVPDLMVYEYVHNGLAYAANNKVVDEFQSSSIQRQVDGKLWDAECKRLVLSWAKLNEDSYNARYKEKGYTYKGITCNKVIKVTALQLVKYVACIIYNIELSTIEGVRPVTKQERDDYALLIQWEQEMNAAIVCCLPGYAECKWSRY